MPGWRNLVDARDLKSLETLSRAGSSPALGTTKINLPTELSKAISFGQVSVPLHSLQLFPHFFHRSAKQEILIVGTVVRDNNAGVGVLYGFI